ncbi:Helix-turn-helix domain-containing protein [Sphingobacterium nematocida]|uniref:Helix-turn-helix domain-containing protein n=1 Tax=Sphingobacterium nematocida TaxID=1513896 RepID=A0A1T5AU71_9SPHI|nr:AraC family transcriptional regulator [Sphingobacterium nematocida]SKB38496.1 Helix-turn-helix domain-containing protein [Sphingobacterium nematocida]
MPIFQKAHWADFIFYLDNFRVKKACELLVTNVDELTISNIAYTCGFTSVSNFNRMFKRIVGVSPSSYVANYVDKYVAAEHKYDEAI